METNGRRWKIAFLADNEILRLFTMPQDRMIKDAHESCISVSRLKDVPEDAKIVRIYHDFQHQAWGLVIEHPDFEIVPYAHELPKILMESMILKVNFKGEVVNTDLKFREFF